MQNDTICLHKSNKHVWLPLKSYKAKVPVNKIIRLEAHSNYTRFYVKDQQDLIIASKTLKYYQEKLEDQQFIRPHQSHLVNLAYIANYSTQNGGCLILKDQTKIEISRRKKRAVLNKLLISPFHKTPI